MRARDPSGIYIHDETMFTRKEKESAGKGIKNVKMNRRSFLFLSFFVLATQDVMGLLAVKRLLDYRVSCEAV